jgi:LCP family protein required for cell wall assembly
MAPRSRSARWRSGPWRSARWPIGVLAALALIGAATLTTTWMYARSVNTRLTRTDAFAGIAPSTRPHQTVTGAMNVLLLGSDSRNPDTTASRSDTIMLLHLDADHQHAYGISIPRDTWVYIPAGNTPHGNTHAKINSAYAWGGIPLAVTTVETFTGVRIDHVVLIDFAGFQHVVDALGGVDMTVDKTITSIFPPHRTFNQGRQHFTGAEALDYVRQRYQYPDGDFTRERHQWQLLNALLDKATDTGTLTNPGRLTTLAQAVTGSVTVDQSFDLVDVALQLRDLRSSDITFLTNPNLGTGWEDGQSVVLPDPVEDKSLYHAVANDTIARSLSGTMPVPTAPND